MANNDFLYEYLKSAYDAEVERAKRLRDRASFICGFLLLLGSGICSLASNYLVTYDALTTRDCIFIGGMAAAGSLLIIASLQSALAIVKDFKYASVRPADEVLKNFKEWAAYARHPSIMEKIEPVDVVREQLLEVYAAAAAHNFSVTIKRSKLLTASMQCSLACGIFLVIPSLCYVCRMYEGPERTVRVELVNPVKMSKP